MSCWCVISKGNFKGNFARFFIVIHSCCFLLPYLLIPFWVQEIFSVLGRNEAYHSTMTQIAWTNSNFLFFFFWNSERVYSHSPKIFFTSCNAMHIPLFLAEIYFLAPFSSELIRFIVFAVSRLIQSILTARSVSGPNRLFWAFEMKTKDRSRFHSTLYSCPNYHKAKSPPYE